MSLYNNVSKSLAEKGVFGSISAGISSQVNSAVSSITKVTGGSQTAERVIGMAGNMAGNEAMNMVNKHIPQQYRYGIDVAGGAIGDLMNGNVDAAGMRILDSGLLNGLFPGMSGVASQAKFWNAPTPLFGGISPSEAKKMYDQSRAQKFSKKNLFLIEVDSHLKGDISEHFNIFVTELDYAPNTITGEKRKIGSASVDSVQSAEPVELRTTTLDNQQGTIKKWFEKHCEATAHADGTVGVPAEYAIRIKIVHAFITTGSFVGEPYRSIGLFRPANMEFNLSRREDGLQEIQLTFSQLDTFIGTTINVLGKK